MLKKQKFEGFDREFRPQGPFKQVPTLRFWVFL